MKFVRSFSLIVGIASIAFTHSAHAQVHGHLNAGAVGTNQNDKLHFPNGDIFAPASGYVKTLTYVTSGKYAGFYQGNITLDALAATAPFGGPVSGAAALGSFIQASIISVECPPDGAFAFWETTSTAGNPTFIYTNSYAGTNLYRLTEGNGSPGSDPYGHIHSRRFTATKPGIYKVHFQLFDTSTNGVGGGPIHSPSDILPVYFQAGINIASVVRSGNVSTVTFGGITNQTFHLESSDDFPSTNWASVGSLAGDDAFQSLTDTNAALRRFYRLRMTTP